MNYKKRMTVIVGPNDFIAEFDISQNKILYWPPIGFTDTVRKVGYLRSSYLLKNWWLGSENDSEYFFYQSWLMPMKQGKEQEYFKETKERILGELSDLELIALGVYDKLTNEEKNIIGECR